MYLCEVPSVCSVQHVALCSFILSVVHLVAQLWDLSYMWQRDDFSFPVVFQCYPVWILQHIVLSREKVWRATLLTLSRVLLESPSSGLCFNEMADRVAAAARKRVRIGATVPCLRPSVAGQGQEQKQDHHLTHSISSEQVCFWLDVARCTDPKSVSHTRKSSKSSSVEITFATANVLSLGENLVTCRRDQGLQISGRRAELDWVFHSTGLQVIGLQECRAKKARRLEGENFHMISESADARGRIGC